MPRKVVVCPTADDVCTAAAQILQQQVLKKDARSYRIALSGGSTPRGLFRLLAGDPYRNRIPWTNIWFFWGDERCVPPDHPDSNFRMAKETLLDNVPVKLDHVFRIEGEQEPEVAAAKYEGVLRAQFQPREGDVPQFDLIVLGLGPDAHTASLFPGTPVLHETRKWVAASWVEAFHTYRITLTPAVLNAGKEVLFLVNGADKAEAVRAVLEGHLLPEIYPAQLVSPVSGNVTWVIDQAAASLLRSTDCSPWPYA